MYVSHNDILPQASMRVKFGHIKNYDTATKLKASEDEKKVCMVIICFMKRRVKVYCNIFVILVLFCAASIGIILFVLCDETIDL